MYFSKCIIYCAVLCVQYLQCLAENRLANFFVVSDSHYEFFTSQRVHSIDSEERTAVRNDTRLQMIMKKKKQYTNKLQ